MAGLGESQVTDKYIDIGLDAGLCRPIQPVSARIPVSVGINLLWGLILGSKRLRFHFST